MEKTYRDPSKESGSKRGSPIARGRGRIRKTIGETIKRDLNVNMIYDITL